MFNIYETKNHRLFPIIPIALLLISLLFIPKIHLDSTLTGGTNIQISTNASMSVDAATRAIDALIPGSTVQKFGSSFSITIPPNQSITSALGYEQEVNAYYANYSASALAAARYSTILSNASEANNQTAILGARSSQSNETKNLGLMSSSLNKEVSALTPIIGVPVTYNSTSGVEMADMAASIYGNATSIYKSRVISKLKSIIPFTTYSYNEEAAQVGQFFLGQLRTIIIIAFVLVGITVFIIFRSPIPSIAVVFGAANDIIIALGAMGAFGIPLGVASIGGLLMLLGYSIDTDVLSAVRILKRTDETPQARAMSTFKTGATMTVAAVISFLTLFIVAYIVFIPTYIEIAGVALFGLIADIATTWLGNTVFILWYKQRKDRRR
jgi:preprotein translocase subunit SecF